MKATQLEQMKEDYSYIMETKARTRDQIEQGGEVGTIFDDLCVVNNKYQITLCKDVT